MELKRFWRTTTTTILKIVIDKHNILFDRYLNLIFNLFYWKQARKVPVMHVDYSLPFQVTTEKSVLFCWNKTNCVYSLLFAMRRISPGLIWLNTWITFFISHMMLPRSISFHKARAKNECNLTLLLCSWCSLIIVLVTAPFNYVNQLQDTHMESVCAELSLHSFDNIEIINSVIIICSKHWNTGVRLLSSTAALQQCLMNPGTWWWVQAPRPTSPASTLNSRPGSGYTSPGGAQYQGDQYK